MFRTKLSISRLRSSDKRKKLNFFFVFFVYLITLIIYCEFLIYYIVELQCKWPRLDVKTNNLQPVKAMILSDIHMLGPRRGHWFDKLRREWQMHRSFQTAVTLFNPDVIFILGDIFDEGQWVNDAEFDDYVQRFYKLFYVPSHIKLVVVVGNHDVGFHYRMQPYYTDRFYHIFNISEVSLFTIRDVHFIVINSMAMENDQCYFCETSKRKLKSISKNLNCAKNPSKCGAINDLTFSYSQPIILQHFPMYRPSDIICLEHDSPEIETYREKWEVLSKDATDLLGNLLNPRLALSGHSHHFCRMKNRLNIEEFTLPSFNWRNKNNPSFILAQFTPAKYSISICYLPQESNVVLIYTIGTLLFVIWKFFLFRKIKM